MNLSNMRLRNLSSISMFIFGVLALALGILGIVRPEATLALLNFEVLDPSQRATGDYSIVFLVASSMASVNMGVYYILASLYNVQIFYKWTVPFRIVTFVIFTGAVLRGIAPLGFIGVGLWELTGAVFTGLALLYEHNRKTKI